MSMDDETLSSFARESYASGVNPIEYAEHLVELVVEVHISLAWMQEVMAGPVPELSTRALASRIVGNLLDSGWVPPGGVL